MSEDVQNNIEKNISPDINSKATPNNENKMNNQNNVKKCSDLNIRKVLTNNINFKKETNKLENNNFNDNNNSNKNMNKSQLYNKRYSNPFYQDIKNVQSNNIIEQQKQFRQSFKANLIKSVQEDNKEDNILEDKKDDNNLGNSFSGSGQFKTKEISKEDKNNISNQNNNQKNNLNQFINSNQNNEQNRINNQNNIQNNYQNKNIQNHNQNQEINPNNNIENQNNTSHIKKTKIGLHNFGKTSYLNSILQCIGNIEYLKNYFLEENNIINIESNVKEKQFSFVIGRLFHHLYSQKKEEKVYSPSGIMRVLESKNIVYKSKNERNPNECLIFILDSLHKELNGMLNVQENNKHIFVNNRSNINDFIRFFYNTNNSIISKNFAWFSKKELICTKCGSQKNDSNNFFTCQLDASNYYETVGNKRITIVDCINFELKKKRNLYCNRCKTECNMEINSKIYFPQNIFVFLLDRGNFDENKLKIPFYLEEQINLKPYIEKNNDNYKFELIAITSINMKEKKYVAFCNAFKDKLWYYFNDEQVFEIDANQVINENNNNNFIPCILFYKSIDEKNI
jgi:ubiquitin C-terminal hydrolase